VVIDEEGERFVERKALRLVAVKGDFREFLGCDFTGCLGAETTDTRDYALILLSVRFERIVQRPLAV
jgi:hypothetical protein